MKCETKASTEMASRLTSNDIPVQRWRRVSVFDGYLQGFNHNEILYVPFQVLVKVMHSAKVIRRRFNDKANCNKYQQSLREKNYTLIVTFDQREVVYVPWLVGITLLVDYEEIQTKGLMKSLYKMLDFPICQSATQSARVPV